MLEELIKQDEEKRLRHNAQRRKWHSGRTEEQKHAQRMRDAVSFMRRMGYIAVPMPSSWTREEARKALEIIEKETRCTR